jgi:hypothetical protein
MRMRERESLRQVDRFISKYHIRYLFLILKSLIYRTATSLPSNSNDQNAKKEMIIGPQRVLPGRLSVCRTFGDIDAKIEKRGGNPNVVIAIPEIKSFRITDEHDFIVIASK